MFFSRSTKKNILGVLCLFLLLSACHAIREARVEYQLVRGSVFSGEIDRSEVLPDHPVFIYKYHGEYFFSQDDLNIQNTDTTRVASTLTNRNGQFLIALPVNQYYLVYSTHEDMEGMTFFMHGESREDLKLGFRSDMAQINIIDTPPTRELPDRDDGRSRAN